jgi:hypothetical protein
MQDQRNEKEPTDESGFSDTDHDRAVLHLLLGDSSLWNVEEIIREVSGKPLDTRDAITRLDSAGLVHRLGEFVFPTRTARRADELENS